MKVIMASITRISPLTVTEPYSDSKKHKLWRFDQVISEALTNAGGHCVGSDDQNL